MASILLVDDDSYFRRLVVPALQARNHVVFEAGRASEANRLLMSRPMDLLIVDGLLPDCEGIAFIEKFRRTSQVPVVFVSAFWKDDRRLSNLPDVSIVRKPVDAAALAAKVQNALRGSGPQPEMSPETLKELSELRETFSAELPGLLKELLVAVKQLRSNPASAALRGVTRQRAHKIAGVAGSFGFTAIGDACAEIEQAILRMSAGKDAWADIDASLRIVDYRPQLACA